MAAHSEEEEGRVAEFARLQVVVQQVVRRDLSSAFEVGLRFRGAGGAVLSVGVVVGEEGVGVAGGVAAEAGEEEEGVRRSG
jgi:hypothetical protein